MKLLLLKVPLFLNLPVGAKGDSWTWFFFSSSPPSRLRFFPFWLWSERDKLGYEMVNGHSARFSSGTERDRFREVIVAKADCEGYVVVGVIN